MMSLENISRVLLSLILFPMLAIGLYHRLRAAATKEKLDRRQEGMVILITLRLVGLGLWVLVFAWLISPSALSGFAVELPAWLRVSGFGMGLIAMAWFWWVFRSLGKNITDTVVTRKEHTMVRHGPYRWVRHPLYTGIVPFGLAIAMLTANWLIVALAAVTFGILAVRTRVEERNLVARFGDSYREYMESTGRFFPKLGG
jgi:protein-S-isoprenylcysteine O-methyltransferase Ste14